MIIRGTKIWNYRITKVGQNSETFENYMGWP